MINYVFVFRYLRKWGSVICGAFFTGGFWGTVAATIAQYGLHISEMESTLYVGLPVAVLMAVFMWPKLPKILGFNGE
jgi:hypothetical protein